MRNWRGLILGGVALALVATGVGVAAAGEAEGPRAPFWPAVGEVNVGPEAGSDLSFPKIEKVSLTCAPDGLYELWYVASSQPGSRPDSDSPADGDVQISAGISWPAYGGGEWSFGGDGMQVLGDSISTGDTQPTDPDWLVFGDRRLVTRTSSLPAPDNIGDGVGVHINIVKYEQRDGVATEVARKRTSTLVPYPDC